MPLSPIRSAGGTPAQPRHHSVTPQAAPSFMHQVMSPLELPPNVRDAMRPAAQAQTSPHSPTPRTARTPLAAPRSAATPSHRSHYSQQSHHAPAAKTKHADKHRQKTDKHHSSSSHHPKTSSKAKKSSTTKYFCCGLIQIDDHRE
jgi:hypothetical protein